MMRKTLIVVFVSFLALAVVAAGQTPPRPGGPGPGGPNPPQGHPPQGQPPGPPPEAVLKEILGFAEGQLADLHALMEARRQAVEALQPQLAEAERALAEALQGDNPEACNVGGKLLAVNALRKQIGQADETFRTAFAALLTAEQRAKVEQIFGLQAALQAAEVLHRLGL